MKRFSLSISRGSLLIVSKTFVCLHLDCADIIFDKPGNLHFDLKLEIMHS